MRRRTLTLAAVVALAPAILAAQTTLIRAVTTPRWEAGLGLEYAQPVSQFREHVNHGFGGGGHLGYHVDPLGVLSLRADVSYISYGHDTHYLTVGSIFQSYTLQEETSNNIIVATLGPQLAVPAGPIRPYINGGVGFAYFYTESSLSDYYSGTSIAQNTNYSDNSLVYTGGAGVAIPLSALGGAVTIDLGARYNEIGRTRYLTKGDIVEDPNSETGYIITPHESDARFVTYHLGVSLAF